MSRQKRLHTLISLELNPTHLEILDESSQHRRPGVETHFTVTVVSIKFHGLSLLARHRLINTLVDDEFKTGMHALSLHVYTPEEWARKPSVLETPACQHRRSISSTDKS